MEEIIGITGTDSANPARGRPLIGVPVNSIGKKIWGIGFDTTGLEIIFHDKSRLVIEDLGRGGNGSLNNFMNPVFNLARMDTDEENFLPYCDQFFGGILQEEPFKFFDEEIIRLIVNTTGGDFAVRCYNWPGKHDIQVKEIIPS